MVSIKALILAAGYAIRLYPLTENTPKPLLEVKGKAILGHILNKLQGLKEIEEVLIVTNHRFHDQFRIWLNHNSYSMKIKLIDDGTISNEDRLGAVGDINFVLKEEEINDDLLVIAGDNLFSFSLQKLIALFQQKQTSIVALHDLKDKEKVKGKYGVAVLNGSKIEKFEEKPLYPSSSLAATACYIFPREHLKLVEQSIEHGKADNPGDLIKFMVKNAVVHGYVFKEPWYDIGSFESLQAAKEVYEHEN